MGLGSSTYTRFPMRFIHDQGHKSVRAMVQWKHLGITAGCLNKCPEHSYPEAAASWAPDGVPLGALRPSHTGGLGIGEAMATPHHLDAPLVH